MRKALSLLRISITLLALLTLLLGGIYPVVTLSLAQLAFPSQASGSLITRDGKVIGSELLGQSFTQPKYFWGRLSATTPPYNAAASSGSNLSPANPKLLEAANARIAALQKSSANNDKVPIDLVTASASGLDPHISAAAAEYQVERVARARGMKESDVRARVNEHTQRWFDVAYVNVLELNMALDEKAGSGARVSGSGK
jgi:potassium-transporting ATPase KdpC subunit